MKIESTDDITMQAHYKGQSPQVHNKEINAVLLQSGWHSIVEGSFKLHKTQADVPFVRFELPYHPVEEFSEDDIQTRTTVEVFPMGLHGVAYSSPLPVNGENEVIAEVVDK